MTGDINRYALELGDFNQDDQLDGLDIDILSTEVRLNSNDKSFDVNSDGNVDDLDRSFWIDTLRKTYVGDANLDGVFNSRDIVEILQASAYQDDIIANGIWSNGDWNGDAEFDSRDLVAALRSGNYQAGLRPLSQPEFDLATLFDTAPVGDFETAFRNVTLEGHADPFTVVALDDGTINSVNQDGSFQFSGIPLRDGDNTFTVTTTDINGTQDSQTQIIRNAAIVMAEGNDFVTEFSVPIGLGQSAGSRTLRFELDAEFDRMDSQTAIEDVFLVYLLDPNDPSQTLLDRGEPGTSLFSLAGDEADYLPGLVRYNGTAVEIDLTALSDLNEGTLVLQMLNSDTDGGSQVDISSITNTVDAAGTASPVFTMQSVPVSPGSPLEIASLTASSQIDVSLQNIRFNDANGRYAAEMRIRNNGTAMGRQVAIVFPNLPAGTNLLDASGVDADGSPYINMDSAIRSGGLASNAISDPMLLEIDNPDLARFSLTPQLLVGGANRPPIFESIGNISVMPGDRFETTLSATDFDGDMVEFSFTSDKQLPTGVLKENGTLIFEPSPDELGTYGFTLMASDGAAQTTQDVILTVESDPITTTRVSGVVLNTEQNPLVGVVVELGNAQAVADEQGKFFFEFNDVPADDTLKIRAELLPGADVYPFIAEKLPLVLGHELYDGVNNVISRPIYLPVLDIANAQPIDPTTNMTIDVALKENEAPVEVFVAARTLRDQKGNMFEGVLSITEVPRNLTPAALPESLSPDVVVTIQPGEMVFSTPAPITLPNRAGWLPGTEMDLWSINPETGLFDKVGTGEVSADASVIETTSGGINNSSWHFFGPPPPAPNPELSPDDRPCDDCRDRRPFGSEVDLLTGAVRESHSLVTYQSLGATRGLTFQYDSLSADPRPIINFGYDRVSAGQLGKIVGSVTVGRTGQSSSGFGVSQSGIWTRPPQGGDLHSALQVDLRTQPSGRYDYQLMAGFQIAGVFGSTLETSGTVLSVNNVESPFGSGWGLSGLQKLVENPDGSMLFMDGGGEVFLFDRPEGDGAIYVSPAGDFSTLERMPDGTFRRTLKDQTAYTFN